MTSRPPNDLRARREFLAQYRKTGIIPDPAKHKEWLVDLDYERAFRALEQERAVSATKPLSRHSEERIAAQESKTPKKPPKPVPPRRIAPPKRPQRAIAPPAPPPAPPPAEEPLPEPPKPADVQLEPVQAEPVPPLIREEVRPTDHGHTRFYVREGQELEVEPEVQKPPRPPAEPDWVPAIEVTVSSDADQRALIDEYGELDRRVKLYAIDYARYEMLKRVIKGWFDQAAADADGTVKGNLYLVHVSARERERKIRSMQELANIIGIEAFFELVTVPIGVLEDRIGKTEVGKLTIDTRTGSRRMKAIRLS